MAYPWSKNPTQVTMRFDLGISRVQVVTEKEYRKMPRSDPVALASLVLRARDCMAGVYQDPGIR
jgi:hypothetical protein